MIIIFFITMTSVIWDYLPDCLLENIYSKIYYPKSSDLLNEIKKYGEIREYIYYIRKIDETDSFLELYYDLLVVYLSNEIDKKEPVSVDINNLSIDAIKVFKEYADDLKNINEEYIDHTLFTYIASLLCKIDTYYLEKIVDPIIYSIKEDEIYRLGYTTYMGDNNI
jgi:hypothetical protein